MFWVAFMWHETLNSIL